MTIILQTTKDMNLQYQKSYLLLQVKGTGFGNKQDSEALDLS